MTTHNDVADAESVVEERLAAQLNDATLRAVPMPQNDGQVDLLRMPDEMSRATEIKHRAQIPPEPRHTGGETDM